MRIQITPKVSGQQLQGDSFSFTRVSWLASDFALQRNDGSWLELTNQFEKIGLAIESFLLTQTSFDSKSD